MKSLNHARGLMLGLVMAVFQTASVSYAQAEQTVLSVWQTYLNACGPILTDVRSGMSQLVEQFPGSGLTGARDFSVSHFEWSNEDFTLVAGIEAYEHGSGTSISCEIWGQLNAKNSEERAQEIVGLLQNNPTLQISGGRFQALLGSLNDDDLSAVNEGTYAYSISGVFPESDVLTLIGFSQDYIVVYYYATSPR